MGRQPAEDLQEASSGDLMTVLAHLQSNDVQPVTITAQTWLTPSVSGTYYFKQLLHGVREGTMTVSVGGQAIYDSSREGEDRFASSPVTLRAEHVSLLKRITLLILRPTSKQSVPHVTSEPNAFPCCQSRGYCGSRVKTVLGR